MSKLKKLKTFLNTRRKKTHNLLVKTIEKMSSLKDESTLAFPLFCSFSQYCWFFVAYLCVAFRYKRGLKMTKRESSWFKSVQYGVRWNPEPMPFLQYSTFCFFSVNHLLYSLACPCPRREWIKKINFYSLISMSCKINPCSFNSLYLDQYQIKIFLKNDNA